MFNLLRSLRKLQTGSENTEFLSTVEPYKFERIFDDFLFLRSSFTKMLEDTFFIFAKKNLKQGVILHWGETGSSFTPFLTHFNYYFLTLSSSIIFYSVDKF
jgi:hypothetical protein